MNLPLQVPPTSRKVSTVRLSGIRGIEGVAELSYESVRNRHFLKLQIMN